MSDLTFVERSKIERLLGMSSGYVLDFTNRTFAEFVAESTGIDIFDPKFETQGTSKANRLRAFFASVQNYSVGKLLKDLIEYVGDRCVDPGLTDDVSRIAERLLQNAPVPDLEAIVSLTPGRDFELIVKSVKESIERNSPETGVDRLHTYVVKYMRTICEKRGILSGRDKPLHSLVGEYTRKMKELGLIESEMTERILKSSISIMEYFNRVRNEQSLAHDNPVLNYSESLLIFNHVTSAIKFVQSLEEAAERKRAPEASDDEVPF